MRRFGRLLVPQLFDQAVGRQRLAGVDGKDCEQRPLLRASEGDAPAVLEYFESAQ